MTINQPKKIVIVEDQALLNMLLVELIEEFGHSTVSFSNGQDALTYLTSQQADLLITDLFMPVMGGTELIEALLQAGINLPIVIVSGVERSEIFDDLPTERAEMLKNVKVQLIEKPLNELNIRFLKHFIDSL